MSICVLGVVWNANIAKEKISERIMFMQNYTALDAD